MKAPEVAYGMYPHLRIRNKPAESMLILKSYYERVRSNLVIH